MNAQYANIYLKEDLFPFISSNEKDSLNPQSNSVIIGFVKKMGLDSFYETKVLLDAKCDIEIYGIVGRALIKGLNTKLNILPHKSSMYREQYDSTVGINQYSSLTISIINKHFPFSPCGCIQVINKIAGEWTDEDELLLESIANVLILSIENIVLIERNKYFDNKKEEIISKASKLG